MGRWKSLTFQRSEWLARYGFARSEVATGPAIARLRVSGATVMNQSSPASKGVQVLLALFVGGAGILAFIISAALILLAPAKDTRSAPDPTASQMLVSITLGLLILASSISCFIMAARLIKKASQPQTDAKNER